MVKTGRWIKLYGSTLDSSIWQEEAATRLVWMTLLMMADWDGKVEASVGGLARRARVSREDCLRALETFEAPDIDSTDGTSGERIEKVLGGWLVLNVRKYRDERTPDQLKKGETMRRWRADQRNKSLQCSADGDGDLSQTARELASTPLSDSGSGSASSSQNSGSEGVRTPLPDGTVIESLRQNVVTLKPNKPKRPTIDSEGFERFWASYDKKCGKKKARESWAKLTATQRESAIEAAGPYAAACKSKQYQKNPTTWLNQHCWDDELIPQDDGKPKHKAATFDDIDYGVNRLI